MLYTGAEVIVWGGLGVRTPVADGARFHVATDRWQRVATEDAPTARHAHSAVWTGREMIVWGGLDASSELGTGARFAPESGRWRPIASVGAPSARHDHISVWTGDVMIVWGGVANGQPLADGGLYDPEADRWRPISGQRAFARADDRGRWTGAQLVVLGEVEDDRDLYPPPSLGVYDPRRDEWSYYALTAMLDRPLASSAVEFIAWGGHDGSNLMAEGVRVPIPLQSR